MPLQTTYMASNEKTKLTSHVHKNYSSKSHHLYERTISRVLWLAFVVSLPCLAPGMSLGYSAIAMDQLHLSVDAQSWFASLPSTMMPVGCLLSGPMMDKLGRKTALLVTNVPSFLGWLLLSMPHSGLYSLYAGQLLVGLSIGLSTTPAAVYSAECITVNVTRLRGCFTIMTSIMLNFGLLLTYLLGSLVNAYVVAFVATLISAAAPLIILALIPESPPWLFEQGRRGDAESSQRVLRISQPVLLEKPPPPMPHAEPPRTSRGLFARMREPDVFKPMAIMTAFLFLQQFSGSFVLTSYMVTLLRDGLHLVNINAYAVTLAAGFVNLGAMALLSVLLSRSDFRSLSVVSCAAYAASMFGLAALLWTAGYGGGWRDAAIVACMMLNMAANGFGLRPIPYAMLGEMFPLDVAGVAGSVVACLSSVFNFAAIKTYPYLFLILGPGVFAGYCAMSLCALAFVVWFVPDTKGKTIKQIGDGFLQRSSSRSDTSTDYATA